VFYVNNVETYSTNAINCTFVIFKYSCDYVLLESLYEVNSVDVKSTVFTIMCVGTVETFTL